MNLAPLKTRLLDAGIFERIAGAAQLAAAIERKQFTAEAYLTPIDVAPGENGLLNATSQSLTETIAVVFWRAAPNDATGDKTLDAIEETRVAIAAQFLGWEPADGYSPLLYAGGRLARFEAGAALWEDSWRTTSYLRATP